MTDADLDELVARVTEATSALIGGHIRRYFDLVDHADDFTPTLEVVETYASGDLAVLVVVEHQHGEIGDRPAQDWSLRVTWCSATRARAGDSGTGTPTPTSTRSTSTSWPRWPGVPLAS